MLGKSQGHLAELEANIQRALNANYDGGASSVAGDDRASLASWVSGVETAVTERAEAASEEVVVKTETMTEEASEEIIMTMVGDEATMAGDQLKKEATTEEPVKGPTFYLPDADEEEDEELEEMGGPSTMLDEDLAMSGEESEEMAEDEEEETKGECIQK